MEREEFDALVEESLKNLPEEFAAAMENIEVVVEDYPSHEQLRSVGVRRAGSLLGLYQGIPLSERASYYHLAMPDRISIFRDAILAGCHTPEEIRCQVRRTVLHEIAHHFGISDQRLIELGAY